jgi:protein TonB
MPRLTIAVITALGLHVLLLMMVFPEHKVIEPEVKGTGHVTVSIVRRQSPVPEVIKEPVVELDQVKQQEERIQQEQDSMQVPHPVQVAPPLEPEKVEEKIVSVKKVVEKAKEKNEAKKRVPVAELVPQKVSEPLQEILLTDVETDSSAAESLRQPEPLETVNRPPVYPALARKRGWQGTVLLEVDVQSDGMVKNIQVQESSSYTILDREARNAVKKWRFSPGLKFGEPVAMKVIVPVHFLLQDN